ncbi:hypothetical protein GBA52_010585 [Prunus armeniaca]|nr:hypothetical protein GBA52_010585 [Prunus armeniaca]
MVVCSGCEVDPDIGLCDCEVDPAMVVCRGTLVPVLKPCSCGAVPAMERRRFIQDLSWGVFRIFMKKSLEFSE